MGGNGHFPPTCNSWVPCRNSYADSGSSAFVSDPCALRMLGVSHFHWLISAAAQSVLEVPADRSRAPASTDFRCL
eukprot:COSAG02_NODE_178_length_31091_cov_59.242482_13_plen_75_part_00